MMLHEYRARSFFAEGGIPVSTAIVASSPENAEAIARHLGRPVVIKAQVPTGGRGKAGGVKYAETPEAAAHWAREILGMEIKGYLVREVLVAAAERAVSEAYVGITLDRASHRPVMIVSASGGVDIEEAAAITPEKVFRKHIDPLTGLRPYQARELARHLYQDAKQVQAASDILLKLYELFWRLDASLAEINPLVVTETGDLLALDSKIVADDNALYRQQRIAAMRDVHSEERSEIEAREANLSFVKLNGTIGCVVNGAGLAMATMDLVKRYGGEPANFLDIGGSSNPQKVVAALGIILSDPKVKAVLFNIFGGITRCDDVANGIVEAFKELRPSVPVVVRLAGTNEEAAAEILSNMQLPHGRSLDEVVQKAIAMAKESGETLKNVHLR